MYGEWAYNLAFQILLSKAALWFILESSSYSYQAGNRNGIGQKAVSRAYSWMPRYVRRNHWKIASWAANESKKEAIELDHD